MKFIYVNVLGRWKEGRRKSLYIWGETYRNVPEASEGIYHCIPHTHTHIPQVVRVISVSVPSRLRGFPLILSSLTSRHKASLPFPNDIYSRLSYNLLSLLLSTPLASLLFASLLASHLKIRLCPPIPSGKTMMTKTSHHPPVPPVSPVPPVCSFPPVFHPDNPQTWRRKWVLNR